MAAIASTNSDSGIPVPPNTRSFLKATAYLPTSVLKPNRINNYFTMLSS